MSNSYDDFGATVNSEESSLHDAGTHEESQAGNGCQTQSQHLTGLDALPTDEFLKIVGLRVRSQRSLLRMSRKRLAEVSGVSERYLAQLESGQGNMSIALLRKVTASIGITLGALLSAEIHENSCGKLNSSRDYSDTANQSSMQNRTSYPSAGRSLSQSSTTVGARPQRTRLIASEV